MHVTKACPHLKLHSHPGIHDAMDGAINKTAKPKMINDECTDESFSAMVKNKKTHYEFAAFIDQRNTKASLTTTTVLKCGLLRIASFNAKYTYAAVGPEYRYPAWGEMHAFGIPPVLLHADDAADVDIEDTISFCASVKYFVSISSNVLGSLEYHDPA